MTKYVINPNTGRKIKVGGATYNKLFKRKKQKDSCKKYKRYKEPKCKDQLNCKWIVSKGCVQKKAGTEVTSEQTPLVKPPLLLSPLSPSEPDKMAQPVLMPTLSHKAMKELTSLVYVEIPSLNKKILFAGEHHHIPRTGGMGEYLRAFGNSLNKANECGDFYVEWAHDWKEFMGNYKGKGRSNKKGRGSGLNATMQLKSFKGVRIHQSDIRSIIKRNALGHKIRAKELDGYFEEPKSAFSNRHTRIHAKYRNLIKPLNENEYLALYMGIGPESNNWKPNSKLKHKYKDNYMKFREFVEETGEYGKQGSAAFENFLFSYKTVADLKITRSRFRKTIEAVINQHPNITEAKIEKAARKVLSISRYVYKTAKHNINDIYTGLRMLRTFKKRTEGASKDTYNPCIEQEQKNIIYHAHTFHTIAALIFIRLLLGGDKIIYRDVKGPPPSRTSIGIMKLLEDLENYGFLELNHVKGVTYTMNYDVETVSGPEIAYFSD